MKILNTLLALVIAVSAFAQSGFEGKISMVAINTATQETANIEWFIKGNKHSMDFKANSGGQALEYTIVAENGSTKMLAGDQVIDIPMSSMQENSYDLAGYIVTEEGGQQKMNGYACNKYTIQSKQHMVEYWLTNETPLSTSDFPAFMQKGLLGPANDLQAGSIPVKLQVKDTNGKMLYSYTINGVTEMAVNR